MPNWLACGFGRGGLSTVRLVLLRACRFFRKRHKELTILFNYWITHLDAARPMRACVLLLDRLLNATMGRTSIHHPQCAVTDIHLAI